MTATTNVRAAERKKLHCNVLVIHQDSATEHGRSVDISTEGISVTLPGNLPAGVACVVAFETSVAQRKFKLTARARVVYSILSGTAGFRVGLQFVDLDMAGLNTVRELTRLLF